ncbi:MAG: ribosome biogenesis GTPase Der [Christensenellales bacterium]
MKPLIAIVGRPNVGKSTLFNKIAGKRVSIVENTPGVTRDRVYVDAEWCGKIFTLIDTGGLELKSQDEMWRHIKTQAELAIDTAQAIIFVVDGKTGVTVDDEQVASYLRRAKVPIVLCVNKVDNDKTDVFYDFYSLGLGEPHAVSAEQGKGIGDLLDAVLDSVTGGEATEDKSLKIAIVGKPNAGKSSITNKLLGYDRVIVSDIAGTTRDAIDTRLKIGDEEFTIIDTAGMRKKGNIGEDLERYSVMRSLMAVRRSDVTVIVCDSSEGMTEQDVKIAGFVHDEGKPSVIVMNKWDLIEKDTHTVNRFKEKLAGDLKFMDYVKPLFLSAKTGKRIDTLLPYVKKVYENASRRISTGLLNEVLIDATRISEPPARNGKRLKIFYITQVSANPPTFVLKVNEPELMHFSYKRYLENALRASFDFEGTPIKIITRKNQDE